MQDRDNGFSAFGKRASFALPLIASVTLALSTLAIVAAVSINAAHAATPADPAQGDGSFRQVVGMLAGGLGGYATLRALQRD